MGKGPIGGTLHAIMREIEPGVFSAEYAGELNQDEGGPETYPDTHIGTDAEGVRMWVEEMAKGMGYRKVVWDKL